MGGKKIAILTSYFYHSVKECQGEDRIIFGGAERWLIEYCHFMQSIGNHVTVYQCLPQTRTNENGQKVRVNCDQLQKVFKGIPIVCLPDTEDDWKLSTNAKLNTMFNEIAVHSDLAIFFATFLAWPYAPRRSISISHGIFWDYPSHMISYGKDTKDEFFRRQLYGFTAPDVCVAVDSNVRRVIQAMEPGKENRIQVIPNFVDTEVFTPAEKNWEGIKVLYPRRLTSLRGCNEFIKATQDYPGYQYLAVGQATDAGLENSAVDWGNGTSNLRFTHKEMDGMEELYQQSDICVIPTKACEGLSLSCMPAGTEIVTENGKVKKIEGIVVGDSVLTHTGQYQKVTETMSRSADRLYKIRVAGGFGTTIEMTGEHPVLTFKPPKHKNGWACRPNCKNHPTRSKYWENATPEWVNASELERGDVVVFPKVKIDAWEEVTIDLVDFIIGDDWIFDDANVWHRYSNSKRNVKAKEVAELLGVSMGTVYHAIEPSQKPSFRWDVEKTKVGKVIKYLEEAGIELTNKFPRYIKMGKDFMRLLGYYIAEGYSKEGVVGFCFHTKEREYHADVINLMGKYFKAESNLSFDGNKAKIIFCGKVIEEVFAGLVGYGARNKKLPEGIMNAPDDHVVELLKGMWRGDGHIRSEYNAKGLASYVSASRDLLQQTHILLTRFGIYGTTKIRYHEGNRTTWALNISGLAAYKLIKLLDFKIEYAKRERASHQQYFEHGGYFCGVIESVETQDFCGTVYNIEVENDNSYIANGIAVHNCLEAMACGLPIITTPVGGIGDATINGYNCLIYDPNHEDLGQYIDIMAKDEEMRKVFGKRNREIAKCFDINIWRERWKQLIDCF